MSTATQASSQTLNLRKQSVLSSLPTLQQIRDERCKRSALYWAQTWTKTENPHYEKQGLPFRAPFPQKSYFVSLFDALALEPKLFVPKSRDMMTSWSALIWATHQAQWKKAFAVVQTMKEGKAMELISYADCLYRNQPEWLRNFHPLKSSNATELTWENGGRVLAVPGGEHQIRTYHPTIFIMDEAAFLPEAEQCYNSAKASSPNIQMIAVSSAGPGWFADQCSQ
jgi:hypothetical protein